MLSLNCIGLEIINLRSLEKEVSWEVWLDPRFPRHPKLKVIFKVTASR